MSVSSIIRGEPDPKAIPSAIGRRRRSATILTTALLSLLGGVPGADWPGFVSRSWGQSPVPTPTQSGSVSKVDTSQPPTPEALAAAKLHFDKGVEFFEHGNYLAARTEFEAAYALSRYPQMLFNLGKTAEKLNQTADAIHFYEGYLLSGPSATDAAEAETRVAELNRRGATPLSRKLPPTPALALLGTRRSPMSSAAIPPAASFAARHSPTPWVETEELCHVRKQHHPGRTRYLLPSQ